MTINDNKMEYIGTVKEGYIFTNRLSGLSKDDVVYNYDKIGKSRRTQKNIKTDYTKNMFDYILIYQGTGRITSKHRVVRVLQIQNLNCIELPNKGMRSLVMDLSYDDFFEYDAYDSQKYAIELEKIEDCDYELSDFVSWNKLERFNKQYPNYKERTPFVEIGIGFNGEQIGGGVNYNPPKEEMCKLTKYTGLTKVIKVEQ